MNVMLTNKAFQGGNSCSHFSKLSIWLEKFFFHVGGKKGKGLDYWSGLPRGVLNGTERSPRKS